MVTKDYKISSIFDLCFRKNSNIRKFEKSTL